MQAFDELLLLKRGGRTIYCGPTGHESQQLVAYFASKKGVEPLPEGTNPASWMLDVRPFQQMHGVLYSWRGAFSLALGLTCAESCCRPYRVLSAGLLSTLWYLNQESHFFRS